MKEFLYFYQKNLHTVGITSTQPTYLPRLVNVVCERPPRVLQKQSSVPGGGGLQNPELPIYLELEFSSHTVILLD